MPSVRKEKKDMKETKKNQAVKSKAEKGKAGKDAGNTFPAIVRKVEWPGLKKALSCTIGSIIAAAAVGGILSAYSNLLQTLVGKII